MAACAKKNPAELLIFGNSSSALKQSAALGKKAGTAKKRHDDARASKLISFQSKFVSSQPAREQRALVEAFNSAYHRAAGSKENPAELLIFGNPAKGAKFDIYGKKYRAGTEAEAKKRALRDRSLRGRRAARKTFGNSGGFGNHKPGCKCAFCERAAQLKRGNGSKLEAQRATRDRATKIREARRHPTHNPKRFSGWSFFTKQEKSFLKTLHAAAPKNEEEVRAYKETLKKIDETNAKHRNPKRATPRKRRSDRKYRNPSEEEEAVRLFESFHGKDPKEIVEKHVSAAMRLDYAALGDLIKLRIKSPLGELYELDFEGEGVKLASSPDGKQLYCIGGRQNIEKCLDADSLQKDFIDLGHCVRVEYFARKIHSNYEPVVYYHKMGEKTGDQPTLIYDKLRKQIFFTGGAYFIDKDKGVSPGIEN